MPSKPPSSIAGYNVLPISLPSLPSFPEPATHYLYIQPHDPRTPNPDSPRSLFVVNIPVTSTDHHFKYLFGTQLAAGRVERVEFQDAPAKPQGSRHDNTALASRGKKRKRETADEIEAILDTITLPRAWDRDLHSSGSHAIVVFVDRASMEASLKAAKKAGTSLLKSSSTASKIVWGGGDEEAGIKNKIPALGRQRYWNHTRQLKYPPKSELLRTVNEYMAVFSRLEQAQVQEAAKTADIPDEDGFVTVTRGPKRNEVKEEELKLLAERQREKDKGLGDFYRFQTREKRKERQGELLKRFEEDKRKVEEMRKRKGKIMPEE
ncbi:Ribosomal RNA-processing protein 7 [Myotisia sp. PD_48]|nr:Ribosomal RNA-processing protein 7 [Myotisia sp. PD_48]